MEKILLISEETLKRNTLINDNIDGAYIQSTICVVQDLDLDEKLGPVLKTKLVDLVQTGAIVDPANAHYKFLLDNYVTPYMQWAVMAQLQLSVNYKITNSGVIENNDDKKSRPDYSTSRAIQSQYEHYATSYALKMQNYLQKNVQYYKEYRKCENFDTSEDANSSGIFFPTDWNRKNYIGK